MSLATRCTACGTIFRVVQDQLRVSEGWVRCGRCAEVFDAREQLFDLDREAPPPWPAPSPESEFEPSHDAPAFVREQPAPSRNAPAVMPPAPAPAAPAVHASAHAAPHHAVRRPIDVAAERRAAPSPAAAPAYTPSPAPAYEPAPPAPAFAPTHEAFEPPGDGDLHPSRIGAHDHAGERREPFWEPPPDPALPAAPVDARADMPEPKGMRFEPEPAPPAIAPPSPAAAPVAQDLGPDVVLSPSLQSAQAAPPEAAGPAPAAKPARKPGFLRRAEGEARWQRPGVRLALGLGCVLLLGGAAAQLTWHYRDALSTQSPTAREWLAAACSRLGCELHPWQRLDAFSVESSGLSEAASGNHYKFSLSLRNKSPWELATPWVELSLNDGNGKVLMKRALRPEDFANAQPSTAPNSEQALQLVFSTGRQRVNGYTVEIFYP